MTESLLPKSLASMKDIEAEIFKSIESLNVNSKGLSVENPARECKQWEENSKPESTTQNNNINLLRYIISVSQYSFLFK